MVAHFHFGLPGYCIETGFYQIFIHLIILCVKDLKGIYPEFQVIRGFSQKIPADLLSDKIHS